MEDQANKAHRKAKKKKSHSDGTILDAGFCAHADQSQDPTRKRLHSPTQAVYINKPPAPTMYADHSH